jgi:flagellar biosynthesis protein FlhA
MNLLQRGAPFVLPLGLIACLLVVLVPLPPGVVDLLLVVNLGLAVLILLTTISVATPLEFSIFPTLLLVTTLGRLVLNVATTRLILSGADAHGVQAAGGIIQGFGQFVAGDKLIVGAIIFAILVIIQFVVITKGASRISEVAARFALDGMPGRQMAVDADLGAGVIDQNEAKRRRNELSQQADFYGAMDGASKFVRGDAIAGMLIISINLVAGLYMGVVEAGMSIPEAVNVYSRLTIGDGLASQLPAFLISLAAGMLISRSAERTNLPIEFLQQILKRPQPLFVSAGFLGLLLFARMPVIPLLLVGGACVAMALALRRGDPFAGLTPVAENEPSTSKSPSARQGARPTKPVEDFLTVDPVEIELGVALLRLADPHRGGDLLKRIADLRNQVAAQLGVVLPKVRIRDNMQLDENSYRIKLFGNTIAGGKVYPLRTLAVGPEIGSLGLDGISVTDPVSNTNSIWIDPAHSGQVTRAGARAVPAIDVIVQHLKHLVRTHANDLLTRDATKLLLDRTRKVAPAVVDELVPRLMTIAEVQQVLRGLLTDGMSIRNLPAILEILCDTAPQTGGNQQRVDTIRRRLGASLVAQFAAADGRLPAVTVADELEEWCETNPTNFDQFAGESSRMVDAIHSQLSLAKARGLAPIVVVRDSIRVVLQRHLRRVAGDSIVLGRREVESFAQLAPTAVVSLTGATMVT